MATNTTSTSQTHNGNGSTATFAISFSFLENTEVDVTVGGVLKTLGTHYNICLLYTSPSPRDATLSRMPSSA